DHSRSSLDYTHRSSFLSQRVVGGVPTGKPTSLAVPLSTVTLSQRGQHTLSLQLIFPPRNPEAQHMLLGQMGNESDVIGRLSTNRPAPTH
ncbi:MAG: hypothetical protein WAN50_03295, partial [Minisyncoccia bacterium]